MSITTLDQVVAGSLPPFSFLKVASTFEAGSLLNSLAYRPGSPVAAVAPTPGLAGAALTTYGGQIPFSNPPAGENTYLAYLEVSCLIAGVLLLYDRLWHNSAIVVTTTTAQVINSVAWPPRDRNGSTNGEGVYVGIEVSTATSNAGAIANTTMSYTNSAGVPGRIGTLSFPATAAAQTFTPFLLDAGDTGVQSIQNVTLGTSYVAGVIHLVAYRNIARVGITVGNAQNARDAGCGLLPRLYDDSVPFLMWLCISVTAGNPTGIVQFTQG